jgi:hypothetical protein
MSHPSSQPKSKLPAQDELAKSSIDNGYIRVEYLTTAGPRITGLFPVNPDGSSFSNENLLAETPDIQWDTPYGPYSLGGGHRLWIAPENPNTTAIPDNSGLVVKNLRESSGVCLIQPANALTPITRSICIIMHKDRPAITLQHELKNEGSKIVKLSPWAITQFPMGGTALIPLSTDGTDIHNLQPNRNLVLWPYTRLEDPRLQISDQGCLLQGKSMPTACKIGVFNRLGWMAYFHKGYLVVKRFHTQTEQTAQNEICSSYPDFGCNTECYVKDRFIELESLGPLVPVKPKESITLIEEWLVFTTSQLPENISAAISIVTAFLSKAGNFVD